MNLHLAMGIFALYVVAVSLLRLMAYREFPRLTAMKKVWGRNRGMVLHFLSSVALPLVLGIVFTSRGVAGFGAEPNRLDQDISWKATIYALTTTSTAPVDSRQVVGGRSSAAATPALLSGASDPSAHLEPISLPWHLPAP